ncbi:efflux RND transporter periplasmic adaptor subunit [bacterium]|nr:efflux RND transporter periplasmic adaptor subunit [bacterium]
MKRIKIVRTIFAAAIIVLMTACHQKEHHREHIRELLTTHPVRQNISVPRDYVCQIRSIQHIELRALEKGYIEKIHIDEGQLVEEGSKLFQVMPRLYRAEYEKAKAEHDFAHIEYENTAALQKKNIVAPTELLLARAKLKEAEANLTLAQVHLDFTAITAPFSGITGRFHVRKGSLVEEGELLTTLSDNSEMWVYFNVPEAEYLEYKRETGRNHHQAVKLVMANQEEYEQVGKITAIEADFNNETGNIAFRATFPNPERILRHGQTGNVILETALDEAILIPQKATFEILDKRFVYVVDEENTVRARAISVLAELPDLFVIEDGITEEETILLAGLRKVRDGHVIKPRFQDPAKVMAGLQVYAE